MLTRHATIAFVTALVLSVTHAHAEVDPPGRVAWLDYLEGSVSFAPAGGKDWVNATLNRPLTTGDSLWVDQAGRSELYIGSTALRLGAQTSLRFAQLDDDTLQIDLRQGTLALRVRNLFEGQLLEIDTPNIALTINRPGEYRVDVAADADTTTITSWQGDSTVRGDGLSEITLRGTQQTVFTGTRLRQLAFLDQPGIDDFDRWVAARDALEEQSVSARYVSRELTGYQALDQQGSWHEEPGYGAVWTPRITIVNWAPYRFGHWVWIAPWGWTWMDDQPWGFAPFHYGRWARLHNKWCWVPGKPTPRPVYAPALVAFANAVSNLSRAPHVSWVPLAPGEVYRPHYPASTRYVNNINQTLTAITRSLSSAQTTAYLNQRVAHAVTTITGDAFVRGRPVQQVTIETALREERDGRFGIAPAVAPITQSTWGSAQPSNRPPPSVAVTRALIVTHPRTNASGEVPASRQTAPAAESPATSRPAIRPLPTPEQPARRNSEQPAPRNSEQPAQQGGSEQPARPQIYHRPQPLQIAPTARETPAGGSHAETPAQTNPAPTTVIRPYRPRLEPVPEPGVHKPATPQPIVIQPLPVKPAETPASPRPETEIRRDPVVPPAIRLTPKRRDNEEQPASDPHTKAPQPNETPSLTPDAEARKRLQERPLRLNDKLRKQE